MKRPIATVSDALGNTPTVCRKYYIHSGLFETYFSGDFQTMFARYRQPKSRAFTRDEQIFARFLRSS